MAKALKAEGLRLYLLPSGGNSPRNKLPGGPGYQVHLAEAARKGAIPVRAVGLITEPRQAEEVLAQERADMVALSVVPFWLTPLGWRGRWLPCSSSRSAIPAIDNHHAPLMFPPEETRRNQWMPAAVFHPSLSYRVVCGER